jgi:predicted Zn finger-like uncharacterized protein
MITTCTQCQARYQLDATRIPPRVIKVRCPSCSGVFSLDGSQAKEEAPAAPEAFEVQSGFSDFTNNAPEEPAPSAPEAEEPAPAPEPEMPAVPVQEPVTASDAGSSAAATVESVAPAETATAVMDAPREKSSRRRRSKEEMLARALVSDIMVYNRELYETAKAENNLLEALGPEIKKSWELYKEKVTPEVANSTNHFRDALNEILAEGEKVF